MRGFGRIPDSPRPVGYGPAMAQVVPCPDRLAWRHSGQCWSDVLATLCGRGFSERLGLEELSRLLYAFLISVMERRGDRGLVGQGFGLPKQASLVSMRGDVSRGSMGAGRPWSSSVAYDIRSSICLGAGPRIKDGQEGHAEERTAGCKDQPVEDIYLMGRLGCRYCGSAQGASRPWT